MIKNQFVNIMDDYIHKFFTEKELAAKMSMQDYAKVLNLLLSSLGSYVMFSLHVKLFTLLHMNA